MLEMLTDILTFFLFFGMKKIKTNFPVVLISKRVIIYRSKHTNNILFALKIIPAHWLLATVEVQKDSSTILFECMYYMH